MVVQDDVACQRSQRAGRHRGRILPSAEVLEQTMAFASVQPCPGKQQRQALLAVHHSCRRHVLRVAARALKKGYQQQVPEEKCPHDAGGQRSLEQEGDQAARAAQGQYPQCQ